MNLKLLNTISLILGVVLTAMGGIILFTAITTAAGLESIVVGGLFTLSGIISIINAALTFKKLN